MTKQKLERASDLGATGARVCHMQECQGHIRRLGVAVPPPNKVPGDLQAGEHSG